MGLFLASVLPLLAGPLLVRALQTRPAAARLLDAFVVISVGGLVFVAILPPAVAAGGGLSLAALAAGLLLPRLSGKLLHGHGRFAWGGTLLLGLTALVVHEIMDGIALARGDHHHDAASAAVAWAVVLHRVPVGLAVWWLVRPRVGLPVAVAAVTGMIGATAVGYFGAPWLAAGLTGVAGSAFQALVAGSLVHVLLGHGVAPAPEPHARWRPASALGALAAVLFLLALTLEHPDLGPPPDRLGSGRAFVALALASAPALLAAHVLLGLVHEFAPARPPVWLPARSAVGQVVAGSALGLWLAACSCRVTNLVRRPLWRELPRPAAVALLLGAPELAITSISLSVCLLGVDLSLARVGAGVMMAATVALALGRFSPERRALAAGAGRLAARPPTTAGVSAPARSAGERGCAALRYGFGEAFDQSMPWVLLGLGMGALVEPLLARDLFVPLGSGLEVFLLALLGVPLFACATGSTPLGAVLLYQGVSPGAVMAFLLAGPATNVPTFRLLAERCGRRAALAASALAVLLAMLCGWTANAAFPQLGETTRLSGLAATADGWLARTCLALLALLVVASLFRQGAEGFVGQVLEHHGRHTHRPAPGPAEL